MKKTYKIEVDCANCAALMEEKVKAIDGVNGAAISFLTQKMVLDAEDDKFDAALKQAVKACRKVDGDFDIEL